MSWKKFSFLHVALILILALSVFSYMQFRRAEDYRLQLLNRFQQAFTELTTAVGELNTALDRGTYATTANLLGQSCTEIYGKAQAASTASGELPYSDRELPNTNAFLSQLADYSLALSKAAQSNSGFSEEDRTNLARLAQQCTVLSNTLQALQAQIHDNHIRLDDYEIAMEQLAAQIEAKLEGFNQGVSEEESILQETPTLIYDGPFSNHIEGLKPKMLEGTEKITEEQAIEVAASFFGYPKASLSILGAAEGKIPTYCVSGTENGHEFYIEVTQYGGYVMQMVTGHEVGTETLTQEDALKRAENFLAERGFEGMHESYHINQSGVITVNFAATQDGIVLYPDLIKVGIALDDGAITTFEAKGYLANHCTRELSAPTISEETAAQSVSLDLDILKVDQVLIPTAGKNEVQCYEFATRNSEGKHYMIYVNVKTGNQEKILILIEDENGTLAV